MVTIGITFEEDPVAEEMKCAILISPGKHGAKPTKNEEEEAQLLAHIANTFFNDRELIKSSGVLEKENQLIVIENPIIAVMQVINHARHSGDDWDKIAELLLLKIKGQRFRDVTSEEQIDMVTDIQSKIGRGEG